MDKGPIRVEVDPGGAMDPQEILKVTRAVESILKLLASAKSSERLQIPEDLFLQYRAKAENLLEAYQVTMDSAERWSLKEELDGVAAAFDAMVPAVGAFSTAQQRAAINAALIRARIRRTHYAAYLAGAACSRTKLASQCKSWLLNIAACGAISLADLLRAVQGANDEEISPMLEEFRLGAQDDALALLNEASRIHKRCWLTNYNTARHAAGVLDRTSAGRRASDLVGKIEAPKDDSSGWELQWHVGNWQCFTGPTDRRVWETLPDDSHAYIRGHLQRLADLARVRLAQRADIAEAIKPSRAQTAIVATILVLGALAGIQATLGPDTLVSVQTEVPVLVDFASHLLGGTPLDRAFGDGGLAFLARGDGGLA